MDWDAFVPGCLTSAHARQDDPEVEDIEDEDAFFDVEDDDDDELDDDDE